MPGSEISGSEIYWCTLDLETASDTQPSVCQISAVFYDDKGNVLCDFDSLVKPPDNITWRQDFIDLHGITPDKVKNEHSLPQVMEQLHGVVEGSHIVAYNAEFDYGCLRKSKFTYTDMWIPEWGQFIDALRISRYTHKTAPYHKLADFAVRHGVKYSDQEAHNSLYDCKVLGEAFNVWVGENHGGDIPAAIVAHRKLPESAGSYEHWQNSVPPSDKQQSYVQDLLTQGYLEADEVSRAYSRKDYSELIDKAVRRRKN